MCIEMFMVATFTNNKKLDTAQEHNKGTGSASWPSLESGSAWRNSTRGRETQEHATWKGRTKDSVAAWFPPRPIVQKLAGWLIIMVGKEIKVGFLIEHCFSSCNVLASYPRTLSRGSSSSEGLGRNLRFCISNRLPGDPTLLVHECTNSEPWSPSFLLGSKLPFSF